MAAEEFNIRITRKGEVLIDCAGMSPQQLRDLAEYLQETLGPVRIEAGGDGGGGGGRVEIEDFAGREAEQEATEERERLRTRED